LSKKLFVKWDLAATMLATTLGIKFNVDYSCDEKSGQFSGKIVKTMNLTQSMEGDENGF
jgi:arginine decarboxylase